MTEQARKEGKVSQYHKCATCGEGYPDFIIHECRICTRCEKRRCKPTELYCATCQAEQAEDLEPDPVNHPPHYTQGRIEVIEAIEDWGLGFHRGNAVKYLARAGKKEGADELEDLKKARFYLEREIAKLERSAR